MTDFFDRLLKKNPAERYQTTSAVKHDIELIVDRLNDAGKLDSITLGQTDQREKIVEPSFVGRSKELMRIQNAMRSTISGRPEYVCISSESGFGKTRLVRESLRSAAKRGFNIFQTAAKPHSAASPYQQLIDIADQVRSLGIPIQKISEQLTPYREEVAQVLPDLAAALGWVANGEDQISGPDFLGQRRVILAMSQFLSALGSPHQPALIWIDDCQWLDRQTLNTFRELASLKAPYTLFIFSMRAEHKETRAEFEKMLPVSIDLTIGPLEESEVFELVQSMAGQLPEDAASEISRLSDGSPFMAAAILRGMVESGAIHRSNDRWATDAEKMAEVQASDSAAEVLMQRIESLPTDDLKVLTVAAVAGVVFEREAIGSVVTEDVRSLDRCLSRLRKSKLIWQRPAGKLSFAHGKIREMMLARLDLEERQPIHLSLANWYSSETPDHHFQIAYHFHQAGLPEKGLQSAACLAEDARHQFSLESAVQQFTIACEGLQRYESQHGRSHPVAFRVHSGLADTLMLLGRYGETESQLELANQNAQQDVEMAWVDMKRGELCFKRGHKARSIPYLESGLQKLGQTMPGAGWKLFPYLLKELATQLLHTVFQTRLIHRLNREPDSNERLILNLYSKLAYAYWYCNCLLYTSPSPRDQRGSRMPSSA